MGDLINLYKLLSDNFASSNGINIFFIVVAIYIAHKIQIIRHPRYFPRYVVFSFILFLIINSVIFGLIGSEDKVVLFALTVLLLLYAAFGYVAAKKPTGFSKVKLKKLEEAVEKGLSWNRQDLFSKKPFYFIDFVERYKYMLLQANHLMALVDFKRAYEIYNNIQEKQLFSDEKIQLYRKKAYVLYRLGDMTRAHELLKIVEDENEPNYLMLKAMIFENALDLDSASEYFHKALNSISVSNDGLLEAMIYNNYGRLRLLEGNLLDAINYYRLSANIAKKHKNKEIIHASFQNLIHISLLRGEIENSNKYLEEYKTLIDKNLLNDIRECFNLEVEIARQNLDRDRLERVLMDGYSDISNRLGNKRQLLFDVSVLRMIFNARMNLDIVMDRIYLKLDMYSQLEMPDRYVALKEIGIVFGEIRYPHDHKFALMHKKVNDYMKKDALPDIENYVLTLKDYEIGQRCHMEKERVGVLKEHIKPYNFQIIYNHMNDIKDIYKKNGMLIDMIITHLDIADECFAPDNHEGERIKAFPLEKMKEHVAYAEERLSKLKRYPIVDECNIRLAMYFFKLNDISKAKKHLEEYECGNMAIDNYAFWVQSYYQYLKSKLY